MTRPSNFHSRRRTSREQERARRRGHVVHRVERAHDRAGPRVEGGLERGEVDRPQRPLREVGRVVVAAPLGGAVRDPVLGAGQEPRRVGVVRPLEPPDARPGHRRGEVRVFPRGFGDPAPPRVSRHGQHRREGPPDPRGARLGRPDGRGPLHRRRVPTAGQPQRDREDRPIAVDHVEAVEERDLQPGLLDGDPLEAVRAAGPPDVHERADQAPAGEVEMLLARPARVREPVNLLELADLLLDRHPRQHGVDPPLDLGAGRGPGGGGCPAGEHDEQKKTRSTRMGPKR